MTPRNRTLLALLAVLAMMFLVNCGGSYGCRVTFGSSTCTPSGSGIGGGGSGGGGGGGGGSATAFAFAVDTTASTIDGFTLNATAFNGPTAAATIAPAIGNDPGAGMVVAQQSGQQPFIYAVFESTGDLFGWSMSSSGVLTQLSGFPASLAITPNTSIPFNQYDMTTNPAGTLLFISNTLANEIYAFQISTAGALTAVVGSPFPTPLGQAGNPGNLTTDGLGKYLYVTEVLTDHTGTEVLAYSIADGTGGTTLGALTALSSSPFAFNMWQLEGDASGNFLVGTTGSSAAPGFRGSDDPHLYVFSIQQAASNGIPAGTITEVTGSPFATTNSPLNLAVQPPSSGGEFVYSFGINDSGSAYNPIEGFQLNATNGTLTAITGFPTTGIATGHWGQFDQSGANLFVYSSISNGTTILTQLGALSIGSNGIPTEPASPANFATPGYWVVTDPQ